IFRACFQVNHGDWSDAGCSECDRCMGPYWKGSTKRVSPIFESLLGLTQFAYDVVPMKIAGLHHVTAIASDPQRNLDFYVGLLGLRFVKRTVNFDDPGTYHFYFGDRRGTPGTILTFFPWPGARRGIRGTGQVEATAFAIPPDSIGYWQERLKQQHVTAERTSPRFGEEVIRLIDPDGLLIELIAVVAGVSPANIDLWPDSHVPAEHALHGFHSVSAALEGYERTARL